MKFKLYQKIKIFSSSKSTIVVFIIVTYWGTEKDRLDLYFPEVHDEKAMCGEEREI